MLKRPLFLWFALIFFGSCTGEKYFCEKKEKDARLFLKKESFFSANCEVSPNWREPFLIYHFDGEKKGQNMNC